MLPRGGLGARQGVHGRHKGGHLALRVPLQLLLQVALRIVAVLLVLLRHHAVRVHAQLLEGALQFVVLVPQLPGQGKVRKGRYKEELLTGSFGFLRNFLLILHLLTLARVPPAWPGLACYCFKVHDLCHLAYFTDLSSIEAYVSMVCILHLGHILRRLWCINGVFLTPWIHPR